MIFVSESITTQITIYQCGCQAYTEDLGGGGEDLHRTGFYTSQTHRYVVQHLPSIEVGGFYRASVVIFPTILE